MSCGTVCLSSPQRNPKIIEKRKLWTMERLLRSEVFKCCTELWMDWEAGCLTEIPRASIGCKYLLHRAIDYYMLYTSYGIVMIMTDGLVIHLVQAASHLF